MGLFGRKDTQNMTDAEVNALAERQVDEADRRFQQRVREAVADDTLTTADRRHRLRQAGMNI